MARMQEASAKIVPIVMVGLVEALGARGGGQRKWNPFSSPVTAPCHE